MDARTMRFALFGFAAFALNAPPLVLVPYAHKLGSYWGRSLGLAILARRNH